MDTRTALRVLYAARQDAYRPKPGDPLYEFDPGRSPGAYRHWARAELEGVPSRGRPARQLGRRFSPPKNPRAAVGMLALSAAGMAGVAGLRGRAKGRKQEREASVSRMQKGRQRARAKRAGETGDGGGNRRAKLQANRRQRRLAMRKLRSQQRDLPGGPMDPTTRGAVIGTLIGTAPLGTIVGAGLGRAFSTPEGRAAHAAHREKVMETRYKFREKARKIRGRA